MSARIISRAQIQAVFLFLLSASAITYSGVLSAQAASSPNPQIPTSPILVSTYDVPVVRVVPVATDLASPFDFAFRDDGDILVTERYTGKLRVIRNGSPDR